MISLLNGSSVSLLSKKCTKLTAPTPQCCMSPKDRALPQKDPALLCPNTYFLYFSPFLEDTVNFLLAYLLSDSPGLGTATTFLWHCHQQTGWTYTGALSAAHGGTDSETRKASAHCTRSAQFWTKAGPQRNELSQTNSCNVHLNIISAQAFLSARCCAVLVNTG